MAEEEKIVVIVEDQASSTFNHIDRQAESLEATLARLSKQMIALELGGKLSGFSGLASSINRVNQAAGSSTLPAFNANLTAADAAATRTSSSVTNTGGAFNRLASFMTTATAGVHLNAGAFQTLTSAVGSTGRGLDSLVKAGSWSMLYNIVRETFSGILRFADGFKDGIVEIQKTMSMLATIQASGVSTESEFEYLIGVANKYGVSLKGVQNNYVQMQLAAQNTSLTHDEVRRSFEQLSLTTRVLHMDTHNTMLTFMAIVQMLSKGTVSMEEFRKQLSQRVPGLIPQVALELGVATGELEKFIAKGLAASDKMLPYLGNAVQRLYQKGIANAASALDAELNRIGNSMTMFYKRVQNWGGAEGPAEVLRLLNKRLDDPAIAKKFAEMVNKVSESLAKFIGSLTAEDLEKAGSTAIDVLKAIADAAIFAARSLVWLSQNLTTVGSALGAYYGMKAGFAIGKVPGALIGGVLGALAGAGAGKAMSTPSGMTPDQFDEATTTNDTLISQYHNDQKKSPDQTSKIWLQAEEGIKKLRAEQLELQKRFTGNSTDVKFDLTKHDFELPWLPDVPAAGSNSGKLGAILGNTKGKGGLSDADKLRSFNDGINAQVEALKQAQKLEEQMTKESVDRISGEHRRGMLEEVDYINQVAGAEEATLIKAVAMAKAEFALMSMKTKNKKELATYEGAIAMALEKLGVRSKKQAEDLLDLDYKRAEARRTLYNTADTTATQELIALQAKNKTSMEEIEALGLTESALKKLTLGRMDHVIAVQEEKIATMQMFTDASAGEEAGRIDRLRTIAAIDIEIQKLDELRNARGLTGVRNKRQAEIDSNPVDKTLKDVVAYLDPAKAQAFGDALADSFGAAGSALKELSNALSNYNQKQAEQAKMLEALANATDLSPEKRIKLETALMEKQTEIQLSSYASVAGAAKGFFKENSKGYKMMEGLEKVYQLMQLANIAKRLVTYLLGLTTQKTAESAQTIFMLAEHAAASTADVALTTSTEAAKNTAKVPGVFMSFMSWLGPWGMAAAGAAIAALGIAVTGGFNSGGDGPTAADIQEKQGTGTVLGDSSAKSESLLKSIEEIEKTDKLGLTTSHRMLTALQSIQASMGALASLIYRTTGLTTGKGYGVNEGVVKNTGDPIFGVDAPDIPFLGDLISGLNGLWGSTKVAIADTGLYINGYMSNVAAGKRMYQYADVQTTEKSWFGLVKETTNSTQWSALDEAISKQFGLIFKSISMTVQDAGVSLGLDATALNKAIGGFYVDTGKISLNGLKGQELQDALNAVISATSDDLAKKVVPGFEKFQKVGEGYYQTLVRVATQNEFVTQTLDTLGLSINMVGSQFSGFWGLFMESFYNAGKTSVDVRMQLIDLAGGIEKFAELTSGYYANYFSDAERNADTVRKLGKEFDALGVSTPKTREEFRLLVESQDLSTVAGQRAVVGLWKLQDAFAGVTLSTQEIVDTRNSWRDKLDVLRGTTTERQLSLQRDLASTTDATTLALISLVYAMENADQMLKARQVWQDKLDVLTGTTTERQLSLQRDLASTTDVVTQSLIRQVYAMEDASKTAASLKDSLLAFVSGLQKFKDSLVLGAMSPLTPEQKYAEASRQFESTLSASRGGDATAQANLTASMSAFLEASRVVNASDSQYTSDFARVDNAITESQIWANAQIDIATASYNELMNITQAVYYVASAVNGLMVNGLSSTAPVVAGGSGFGYIDVMALNGLSSTTGNSLSSTTVNGLSSTTPVVAGGSGFGYIDVMAINGSHAGGLASVPFDGYIAKLHKNERVLTSTEAINYSSMGRLDMAPLVEEIKALRAEVSALRAEQAEQTGAIIKTNYDATDRAANKVSTSTKEASKDAVWADKSKAKVI